MTDTILVNGNIRTGEPGGRAEAVAIRDGRVLAVGGNDEVRAAAGGDAEVVDLGGATVIPGLIDPHNHLLATGLVLGEIMLFDVRSIGELQARVSESEGAYNDLLTFSNTREHELQSQIEELSKPLSPVARAADACAADPGGALAHILGQEVDLLEKDLAQEREAMANLREWSAQRQQALQARIHELGRILNGGADPGAVRDAGRDGAGRIRTPDATRLQAEMDTLRATHAQAMRTAEERVTDLTRKLRTLENEEVRLRAHVTETDKLTRANQELTETVRRREQEVGQERKNREVERENFAATQQALLRRIEQLERSSDDKGPVQEPAAANPSLREIASVRPQRPNLAPWFRLKR